ncbi:MAG: hypothetical protein COA62_04590 [Rhodobiaceae bacterium]|nr:MAG: hypothetical protein COA62_04590 [Rhodobiaceae bacterium]
MFYRKSQFRLLVAIVGSMAMFFAAPAGAAETLDFYITTVHVDGKTNIHGDANHPPEAFPLNQSSQGPGVALTPPDATGAWKIRTFIFEPAQIIAREGDHIRLHFVGVQGAHHTIKVIGEGVDAHLQLDRGYVKTVDIPSVKTGTINIICDDHQPTMNAQVIVLPAAG